MSSYYETLAKSLTLIGASLLLSLPLTSVKAQLATDLVCGGCVDTTDIANGAVTRDKIADEAVNFRKLAIGAVGTGRIADEAVTWRKIKPGAVGTGRLADGAVTTAKISDGSVTSAKIANGQVKTADIMNLGVLTEDLADGSVTTPKLADLAVTTPKLADLAVTTAKLASNSVGTAKIKDGAVTAFKLAAGSVTEAALAVGSVTAAALAPGVRGATQSDHALFGSPPDTAIYCGVELDEFVEPWTLHITASAPSIDGTVTITFNDGVGIPFAVAGGSSLSITQSMGGVGGVTNGSVSTFGADDLVKITAADGVINIMASASARDQATDPFDETFGSGAGSGAAEPDNFCITAPLDPGVDWAVANFPEHS